MYELVGWRKRKPMLNREDLTGSSSPTQDLGRPIRKRRMRQSMHSLMKVGGADVVASWKIVIYTTSYLIIYHTKKINMGGGLASSHSFP